jgi:cell division transport system permease protein
MRMKKRSWVLQITTLIVATACFLVMSSSLLISQNLKKVLTLWGEDIQMTVYISPDIEPAQKEKIEEYFRSEKRIKEGKLITQAEALHDFRGQLATYAPDLAQDEDLLKLIPASYQVSLDSSLTSTEQVALLKSSAENLKKLPGVEEVSYGQDWVEKYSTFVSVIQRSFEILGLILIAASIFVMSNVVRALVQSRQEEIEVLELIGATPSMIRKPFLVQGLQMGLLAGAFSLLLSYGAFKAVQSVFMNQLSFLRLGNQLQFLTPVSLVLFLIAGTLLGLCGSYLSVRKINDGWAASRRG